MPALTASLEIITSPLLGDVRHGFFTRRGGASSGIFEGLNCGGGSSDQSAIVATNRDRVARAMDVPADRLVTVHQAHTARAVTLSGPMRRSRSRPTPSSPRPRVWPSRS
jgi:copper oxidase (laccase) domain-containing protein